jgi:putative hemolysin
LKGVRRAAPIEQPMAPKKINIRESLGNSQSALLRALAREPTGALERYVCEAQANAILEKLQGHDAGSFLRAVIEELHIDLRVRGEENLPQGGRCVFVANHPFGVIDGIILTAIVSRRYGRFQAIANDAFMLIDNLKGSVVTANVYGRTPREGAERILALYQSDTPITHFPAGEVSRLHGVRVCDGEWHKSFVKYAVMTKRDVVPVHFAGRNSRLFYAVHLIRRLLRIGTNIEMSLLPRETFAKRGSTVEAAIGPPIGWQTLRDYNDHRRAANAVRDTVYAL